ncbi:MAG: MFS transporter [Ruminococcaceae bacterium]|nr:MFS transporter [Oscillospiraceae bacterium]
MKTGTSKGKFYLALVIFSLIGQVAWVVENMYLNVFIYKMFHATAEQISLMVAASAVTATVTTLLIGALSDKLGKRKVFICAGYILWGLSILGFALIRTDLVHSLFFPLVSSTLPAMGLCVTLTIALDCVMTFFGSSANDAAFNAWLTDATDETNRGAAEGINAMMPLVAILVVFGGFMGMDQSKAGDWTLIFTVIGGVVTALGIAGFFFIQDTGTKIPENQNYFANIFYGFRPSVLKANKPLYVTLLLLALFNISIQVFMPYLILYYTEALGLADYVLIFAPAIILSAAFTAVYGRVYDKFGFKTAIIPTLSMLMIGYVLLFFVRGTALVFVGSLIMMCGFIGTGAVIGALIRDCTPKNRAGMFQGLRIVGQVLIPGVVGPAIGAAVLQNADTLVNSDGTTSFIPNENIFLAAFIAAIFAWLVLIPLCKMVKKK